MVKEYQVMSDGTFLIKATVQVLQDELNKQSIAVRGALDYFLLAEKLSGSKQFIEADKAYGKSADILPTMSIYLNWGNLFFISGRIAEALQHYSNGLSLAEKNKNKWFEGAFLSNIGHLYYSEGNSDESLKYFIQALPTLKDTRVSQDLVDVLLSLLLKMEGIYNQKKELELAIECLQQALVFFREIGQNIGVGRCLNNLGLTSVARKDFDQALTHFREALNIFKALGSREDEAEQLGNLGSVFRDTSENDLALKHYRESLAIFKEIGHELGEANELGNIGYILYAKGKFNSALDYFRQAEKLYLKLGVAARAEVTRKNIDNLLEIII
ncbi:MAG: tetratricopeptide repeat protein [Desulfitobacteriaceae bacterium]